MTTTRIETLPANWLDSENFGVGWDEAGIDPVACWERLFDGWLYRNHPDLTRCGNEIIGPADYECEDGLYEAFEEEYRDTWADAIERVAKGEGARP